LAGRLLRLGESGLLEFPISVPRSVTFPSTQWRIGENVPWSVAWTGEQEFNLQMSQDFDGLVEVVQVQRPGDGLPSFAAQHVTRHRLGMSGHFCHVCGKPTRKQDRFIFPVQSGGFVTMPDESVRYAGNVPPVHLKCAALGQRLCPHLSHTVAEPVVYPSEPSRLLPRPDVVPGLERLAATMPPDLKIVYGCYRLYGPRFTRLVLQLREKYAGGEGNR
jgi:hypothetical protein